MKNICIVLSLLLCNISTHSMKNIQPYTHADHKAIHLVIIKDYEIYLKKQLEEYNNASINNKTSINMNKLITAGTFIANVHSNYLKHYITETCDEQNNNFWHIAVKNDDLDTITWLIKNNINNLYEQNSQKRMPFDICIKKLSPKKNYAQNSTSYAIFMSMLEHISQNNDFSFARKECLNKIINLQLKHTLHNSIFHIDSHKLSQLCPYISLSTLYQQAKNKDGNTFTHALYHNPDDLWQLIQQDHISFEKNNNGISVCDLALKNFRYYTRNSTAILEHPEDAHKARCSFYILLNYLQSKNNNADDKSNFDICCNKHAIVKK